MAAGPEFIDDLVKRCCDDFEWVEQLTNAGPVLQLESTDGADAGYVRLWQANNSPRLDRMVHIRLIAGPVETQLFFVFGLENHSLPHFHAQVVEFPPDGCVYNVDLVPRLDAAYHQDYLQTAFKPLSKPYHRATNSTENTCSRALMNPLMAAYLSPWGIVSHRTDIAEFERVRPQIEAYLDHYLHLCASLDYADASPDELSGRCKAHLDCFLDDNLDPRAWKGVYNVVGEPVGQAIKTILRTPLRG